MAHRKHKSRTKELRSRSREDLERYAKSKLDAGKPRQAREAYKELVRLDPRRYTPDLLRCYLAQARQMAQAGQLAEAARLLDTVRELDSSGQFASELAACKALITGERGSREAGKPARRAIKWFPNDKEILHKAALLCFERSADKKGLGYLERAHELDPLDRGVRTTLIRRYVANAATALVRRRTKQMRELMNRAEAASEERTHAYELGRRYVLVRRAAMEDGAGDKSAAREYLTRAFGEAAHPVEMSSFALLACLTYHGSRALAAELERRVTEQLKADAGMPAVATMVSVLAYMLHNEYPREHVRRAERERLSGLATRAVKGAFVRPAAVTIARYAIGIDDLRLAKRYAATALRADSDDPFFRILEQIARKPFHFEKLMEWMQRMRNLQAKARERNDEEAVALAEQALSKVEASFPMPLGLFNPFREGLNGGVLDDDDDSDEPPPPRRRRRRRRISEDDELEPF